MATSYYKIACIVTDKLLVNPVIFTIPLILPDYGIFVMKSTIISIGIGPYSTSAFFVQTVVSVYIII